MGPAGLTAVFGMGTGGAPPVSSPESGRGGGQAAPAAVDRIHRGGWVTHAAGRASAVAMANSSADAGPDGSESSSMMMGAWFTPIPAAPAVGRRRIGVVKPLGC